jgi:hypothetical protein
MNNTINTPKGKAVYPHVNEPNTRFNPMGEYSCSISVSEEDGEAFNKQVTEIYEAAYQRECLLHNKKLKKASSFPVSKDDEGDWVVKAKQPAKVETKAGKIFEFSIKLFDAQGSLCNAQVGSGSTVKCAVEPRTWFVGSLGFGITLSLKAVQVIDLVEQGGSSATSFGFGAEEGYVGEKLEEAFVAAEDESSAESAFDF